jgi:hypothetical protein
LIPLRRIRLINGFWAMEIYKKAFIKAAIAISVLAVDSAFPMDLGHEPR